MSSVSDIGSAPTGCSTNENLLDLAAPLPGSEYGDSNNINTNFVVVSPPAPVFTSKNATNTSALNVNNTRPHPLSSKDWCISFLKTNCSREELSKAIAKKIEIEKANASTHQSVKGDVKLIDVRSNNFFDNIVDPDLLVDKVFFELHPRYEQVSEIARGSYGFVAGAIDSKHVRKLRKRCGISDLGALNKKDKRRAQLGPNQFSVPATGSTPIPEQQALEPTALGDLPHGTVERHPLSEGGILSVPPTNNIKYSDIAEDESKNLLVPTNSNDEPAAQQGWQPTIIGFPSTVTCVENSELTQASTCKDNTPTATKIVSKIGHPSPIETTISTVEELPFQGPSLSAALCPTRANTINSFGGGASVCVCDFSNNDVESNNLPRARFRDPNSSHTCDCQKGCSVVDGMGDANESKVVLCETERCLSPSASHESRSVHDSDSSDLENDLAELNLGGLPPSMTPDASTIKKRCGAIGGGTPIPRTSPTETPFSSSISDCRRKSDGILLANVIQPPATFSSVLRGSIDESFTHQSNPQFIEDKCESNGGLVVVEPSDTDEARGVAHLGPLNAQEKFVADSNSHPSDRALLEKGSGSYTPIPPLSPCAVSYQKTGLTESSASFFTGLGERQHSACYFNNQYKQQNMCMLDESDSEWEPDPDEFQIHDEEDRPLSEDELKKLIDVVCSVAIKKISVFDPLDTSKVQEHKALCACRELGFLCFVNRTHIPAWPVMAADKIWIPIKVPKGSGLTRNTIQNTIDNFESVYVVMPRMARTLKEYIVGDEPPVLGARMLILFRLLVGVAYMHVSGFIHRDLKPENVLISESYGIKIMDFGQGRDFDTIGQNMFTTRVGLCTLLYASPETLHINSKVTTDRFSKNDAHAADMWSLGCIASEMIIRKPIFNAKRDGPLNQLDAIAAVRGVGSPIMDRYVRSGYVSKAFSTTLEDSLFQCIDNDRNFTPEAEEEQHGWSKDEINTFLSLEKDLISKLLDMDASKRPTALDALHHDFFKEIDEREKMIDDLTSLAKEGKCVFEAEAVDSVGQDLSRARNYIWDLFLKTNPEVKSFIEGMV